MASKKGWISFTLFIVVILEWICANPGDAHASAPQSIHFIDVGQGDAVYLTDGNGYDVLIDGGIRGQGSGVVSYLLSMGVTSLETMLATHADADHVGGLIAVLQSDQITVGQVYSNGYQGTTQTWTDFVAAVNTDSLALIPLQYPAELDWGLMHVTVLNPSAGLTSPDTNPASVVVRVDYLDMRYLLTGDIDQAAETDVLARGVTVDSEILKVAHHGSAVSSGEEFLAAVQPEQAIISVGDNPYGHPADETLVRLADTGAEIWRTDWVGTVDVTTDGLTYYIIEGQWHPLDGFVWEFSVYFPDVRN